ncbi:MAG: hypothetical protein KBT03_02510, partial [Bacteroidales bacterium]|nr:hypothetical protein [Candidatus Scybalousia scybalohippi]
LYFTGLFLAFVRLKRRSKILQIRLANITSRTCRYFKSNFRGICLRFMGAKRGVIFLKRGVRKLKRSFILVGFDVLLGI